MTEKYPEMLSPREVARRTGLSYDYLRNSCLKGEIPHIRCGRDIKIKFTRFAEMLDSTGLSGEVGNGEV